MKIIRMSFSEAEYDELERAANQKGITVQDQIRSVLFHKTSIFTPEEAEKRANERPKDSGPFSLSDLYTAEEWASISNGEAGVFGRKFLKYVEKSNSIEFLGTVNRKARYIVK